MTWQQFCYWLQGAYEIGDLRQIDAAQCALILDRLDRVQQDNYFTASLRVLLTEYVPQEVFPHIIAELQKTFQHDIDPTYDGDQNHFNAVHEGRS